MSSDTLRFAAVAVQQPKLTGSLYNKSRMKRIGCAWERLLSAGFLPFPERSLSAHLRHS
jgi:hypothetical protein